MFARMHYRIRLDTTAFTVGQCSCLPPEGLGISDAASYLAARPMDEFMHKFLLSRLPEIKPAPMKNLLKQARKNRALAAVLYVGGLQSSEFMAYLQENGDWDPQELTEHTPLIDIRTESLADQPLHRLWTERFRANLQNHEPLPDFSDAGDSFLFTEAEAFAAADLPLVSDFIEAARADMSRREPDPERPSAEETARTALRALSRAGVRAGQEMRHVASLSPIGLLREWDVDLSVDNGALSYGLSGELRSWGKGLDVWSARASYLMEMVERRSAWASFAADGPAGYAAKPGLRRARFSELAAEGTAALDPASLRLEVPYEDQPLWWVDGDGGWLGEGGTVLVPAQLVYQFCNLDEPSLCSALGSTGLASGNTMAEARQAALLEVVERDAEAVVPFDPAGCFRLETDDPELRQLLESYEKSGVHVLFQDITPEYGVPCYKAFVVGSDGDIVKGTAAHLDGRRAIVSALTEVPYPYPDGPSSKPLPGDIPGRRFEELPDMSAGTPTANVLLLERLFDAMRGRPVYVDLTREDLGLPVVKAVVPGVEMVADFDRYSRVSPRLWAAWLRSSRS